MDEPKPKQRRGFACMDPQRQREIASLGGRTAHQLGVGHEYTTAEAKIAGSKGGKSKARKRQCD